MSVFRITCKVPVGLDQVDQVQHHALSFMQYAQIKHAYLGAGLFLLDSLELVLSQPPDKFQDFSLCTQNFVDILEITRLYKGNSFINNIFNLHPERIEVNQLIC